MKRMKSILYISVIPSILIMVFLGTVYGGSVTLQREAGLQTGQESTRRKRHREQGRQSTHLLASEVKE